MTLSEGERLILVMLAGIYKKLQIEHDPIDPNVVLAGTRGDRTWILQWEYGDIVGSSDELRPVVKETCDILDMYRSIESSFKKLSKDEKERIKSEADPYSNYIAFQGFDGNNDDHYQILSDLVNVLERYEERKGGIFNSHTMTSLIKYRKMLTVFYSMSDPFPRDGLTGDQIIQVVKA